MDVDSVTWMERFPMEMSGLDSIWELSFPLSEEVPVLPGQSAVGTPFSEWLPGGLSSHG